MNSLDAQGALVSKLAERGKVKLIEDIRRQRGVIANRRSADGTLRSGAFIAEVTRAYVDAFQAFARGLFAETFDLMVRSGVVVDTSVATWVRDQLDPLLAGASGSVCGEARVGRVLETELKNSVQGAMDKALTEMRRDLEVELDLALVSKPQARATTSIDQALMDVLVPLQNRRGLEQEFALRTQDDGELLAVVLFDIDHFKQVNDDNGGHAVGNEALTSVAATAAACLKGKGHAFRIGGDEFAFLLPNHDLHEALAVAERFRRELNKSPRTSANLTLSASVGVAIWPSDGDDLDAMLKAADAAMYDAKNRGRNLVRYHGEQDAPTATSKEPDRKQPEPGGLTGEEQLKIRQDYFRAGSARCPRDQARLKVQEMFAFGQSTPSIWVNCPLCGLSTELN